MFRWSRYFYSPPGGLAVTFINPQDIHTFPNSMIHSMWSTAKHRSALSKAYLQYIHQCIRYKTGFCVWFFFNTPYIRRILTYISTGYRPKIMQTAWYHKRLGYTSYIVCFQRVIFNGYCGDNEWINLSCACKICFLSQTRVTPTTNFANSAGASEASSRQILLHLGWDLSISVHVHQFVEICFKCIADLQMGIIYNN